MAARAKPKGYIIRMPNKQDGGDDRGRETEKSWTQNLVISQLSLALSMCGSKVTGLSRFVFHKTENNLNRSQCQFSEYQSSF
jgi:hypothetical protein